MRSVRAVLWGTVLIALCVAPASAEPRRPTAPWNVDYGNAQCTAMRQYGTDARPLALVLKPSPNDGVMRLLVVRRGVAPVDQAPAALYFGGERINTNLLTYSDDKNHYRVAAINVPMDEFRAHVAAPWIRVTAPGLDEEFAITNLAGVLGELGNCLADLQEQWNFGDRYRSRLAAPARPVRPLRELFSSQDYPGIALALRQEGKVRMTFLVDEKGEVSDCSVDETSGIPVLDVMSCYV